MAPTVGTITAPVAPVSVGTSINASASFTDSGTADTHTAVWSWGDGTTSGTVTEVNGSGSHANTTSGGRVVSLYQQLGRPAKVAKWQARVKAATAAPKKTH